MKRTPRGTSMDPKETADDQINANTGKKNNQQQFGKNRTYDSLKPVHPQFT
jgi:hypothetical protein